MANPHTTTDDWPALLQERFQPIEVLARGRISTVWKATDDHHQRPVALKILHPHLADQASIRQRMRRELATVRRLNHPAIIDIFDFMEGPDQAVLVMEWIDGPSLREHVQESGPMTWEAARTFLKPLLEAIGQAHERGIWHRDLSSDHIMIDPRGHGRIVGFGMARVNELVGLTQHTRLLGSLEAMAPERLLGLDYDGRADLYSLGAVAHELLLGHWPTDGSMQQSFSRATRLSAGDGPQLDLPEDLPEQARYLLERALMGDPSLRFATADRMARALDDEGHRDLWEAWSARTHQPCPDCQAPLIDGLQSCIQCGHDVRRLIHEPDSGNYGISIVSPHEAFAPDEWFAPNPHPHYLTDTQYHSLVDLMNAYADTRAVFREHSALRWPPYVLVDDLSYRELDRVHKRLEEHSIPHRFFPDHVNITMAADDESLLIARKQRRKSEEQMDNTVTGFTVVIKQLIAWGFLIFAVAQLHAVAALAMAFVVALVAAPILFAVLDNRDAVAANLAIAFLLLMWPLLWILELSPADLMGPMALFLLSLTMTIFAVPGLLRWRSTKAESKLVEDRGAPILATKDLQRATSGRQELALPTHTSTTLSHCKDDALRDQLHDLLLLASRVATEAKLDDQRRFTELVDALLDTARRLDRLLSRLGDDSTADLQARLENASHESTRRRLLRDIEKRDAILQKITALRSILQTTRGALLDLAYQAHQTPIRTTSSFQDRVTNALEDIEINLSAALEAHDLAPEAS